MNICIEPGAVPLLLKMKEAAIEITPDNIRDLNGMNALIEQGLVIFTKKEITGYWGFERWMLCIEPSWRGREVAEFYGKNAAWLDKVIENARNAWACAG